MTTNTHQKHRSTLLTRTTQRFRLTVLAALVGGYGLLLAYSWPALPARLVIIALFMLLALLAVALSALSRQALLCLCMQQQAEEEHEAQALRRLRDALLLDHDEVDGLPRLAVFDGPHGGRVLTPEEPDYPAVAQRLVKLCPQAASLLLRRAGGESARHEEDRDRDDDGGQFPHPETAQS